MRLHVGSTVTIRGRNFSSRRKRNTVVFRASNGRSAFAKPRKASSRKLVLKVPAGVARILQGHKRLRFKLRVVVRRKFSRWTPKRLSPVVLSGTGGGGGGGGTCPDDGDLLTRSLELSIGTDPCLKDTDGDGVEDGYEYQSALDLNDDEDQSPNASLPYPGKRPYPNPLDPGDRSVDFDGDSLTLSEEQALWRYSDAPPRTRSPLTYSDGEQYSAFRRRGDGRREPTLAAYPYARQQGFLSWASGHGYRNVALSDGPPWHSSLTRNAYGLLDVNRFGGESVPELKYYDYDGDNFLSDDERDEDADGLTNFDETHGRMQPGYWTACYSKERPYPVHYAGTSVVDEDTDGDGVRDGADDQDHDDVPNLAELSRINASNPHQDDREVRPDGIKLNCKLAKAVEDLHEGEDPPISHHSDAYGFVNPFNPCLPATWSRTCTRHPTLGTEGAPFDNSPNWYALN
jgi:hypothetical protein